MKHPLLKFVRFGKIGVVKQKGYTTVESDKSFHSPPAKKGFYAMPFKFQELFLVGCISATQNIKLPTKIVKEYITEREAKYDFCNSVILRDENNKPYIEHIEFDLHSLRKNFTVSKDDLIWSHLDLIPNHLILARDGSWINCTVGTYIKYLPKFHSKNKLNMLRWTNGDISVLGNNFSKDVYEVFFEDKVAT